MVDYIIGWLLGISPLVTFLLWIATNLALIGASLRRRRKRYLRNWQ